MIKNRLTQRDDQENWCVKGLPWKDTYEGSVVTRNASEKIYGVLRKLYDYENTGIDPDRAQELKERDTAKKPNYEGDGYADGDMVYDTWICPNCEAEYEVDYDNYNFCPMCGQRIDWS